MTLILFASFVAVAGAVEVCKLVGTPQEFFVRLNLSRPHEVHVNVPAGVGVTFANARYAVEFVSRDAAPLDTATVVFELWSNRDCADALAAAQFVVAANTTAILAVALKLPGGLKMQVANDRDAWEAERLGDCERPENWFIDSNTNSDLVTCVRDIIDVPLNCDGAAAISPTAALATTAFASLVIGRNGLLAPLAVALGGAGVFGQEATRPLTETETTVGTAAPLSDATTTVVPTTLVNTSTAPPLPFTGICTASVRLRWKQAIEPPLCSDPPVARLVTKDRREDFPFGSNPGLTAVCGRPFVSDSEAVVSNASAATDDERAARWVSQGLGEHASVASFAAFSLQLMVNGAPFSLLTGAAKANADEVRHAEQSFALASRFAGHPITAEPFPRRAISAMVPQSLEELAEAAFREGCIAETLSVFAAARQVDENDVVDDEERAVLTGIVRDEARHSALAWRTVAWATAAAKNAALNAKLMQIAVDESKRCAEHTCVVFERLIARLAAKLIGADDWQRVVESDDVDVEMDASRTLTASTIDALIQTFA